MEEIKVKPWPVNPSQETTDDYSAESSPVTPRSTSTIRTGHIERWESQEEIRIATQASKRSATQDGNRIVIEVTRRSWADETSSVASRGQYYNSSSVSTTSDVIDFDALSEHTIHPEHWSAISDEEDVDHAVPSNVISRSTLVRSALANADAHSNGYVPSRWRVVDENDVASDVIGFGSQWSSIEVFAEASIHVASSKDHQAARERAAEELSHTIICRVFDDAGIPDHSLQHAGPTILSAHHGASQMLISCSHPNHKYYHGDCEGQ